MEPLLTAANGLRTITEGRPNDGEGIDAVQKVRSRGATLREAVAVRRRPAG